MRPERHPTRAMTALGVGVGSVAILLPLAIVEPTISAAVAVVALLGVVLLATESFLRRFAAPASVIVAPLFGVSVVATAVVHISPAAVLSGPTLIQVVSLAAGGVAGLSGAIGLWLLWGSATRTAETANVRGAAMRSTRVAVLFALAGGAVFAVSRVTAGIGFEFPVDRVISGIAAADQAVPSLVVLLVWAAIPAFAANLLGSVQKLFSIPLHSVLSRVEAPADATVETDDGSDDSSPNASDGESGRRLLFAGTLALVAFLRQFASAIPLAEQDPRVVSAVQASQRFGEFVTTESALRLTLLVVVLIPILRAAVAAVGWVQRRYDQSGRVMSPTLSLTILIATITASLYATAPAYRPQLQSWIVTAGVSARIVRNLSDLLLPLMLAGVGICAALTTVLLLSVRVYSGFYSAGATDWLVYRNLVFVSSSVSIIAATVYGTIPLVAFVAIAAALLAWDFLEYGYTLAAELETVTLQPPELTHGAASVGVGIAFCALTLGLHHAARTLTPPPTSLSLLAIPLLVLAVALLLLYFNTSE